MKILHVGFGFRPWRSGGLIQYAEDLMQSQVDGGDTVGYFFSGRQYPFFRGTRLRRWRRSGVVMFEVINSPIHHGGDRGSFIPDLDLNERETEALFREVLRCFDPDVVHVQELAGLPTSLIPIVHESCRAPVVMTLQDYYALCPTLKLYDTLNEDCVREAHVGEHCVVCCRNAAVNQQILFNSTVQFEIFKIKEKVPAVLKNPLKALMRGVGSRPLLPAVGTNLTSPPSLPLARAVDYQHRRETNRVRLRKVDLLIAQSNRVGQLYEQLGAVDDNLHTINLTLSNLKHIYAHRFDVIRAPLRFVTLNGCYTRPKGAYVILDALQRLNTMGFGSRFELHAWGGLSSELAERFLSITSFHYRGWYKSDTLNAILNDAHIGIIPSVWEEAFGFVGLEYLAKGIPIIGNAKGGIIDYTRDGFTGWLNRSNDGAGLASLMVHCIERPDEVLGLNRQIIQHRDALIKGMDEHGKEMKVLYNNAAHRRSIRIGQSVCAG